MTNETKSINVSNETWKRLYLIKIANGYATMTDVIKFLLNQKEAKKNGKHN